MHEVPLIGQSRQETTELICPVCQHEFAAPVWLVVDAQERPDLKAAILDGSLQQFACPNCGAAGTITAPMLYHDGASAMLVLALPLSIQTPAAAQELTEQLHGYLIESLQPLPATPPAYLSNVQLAAELDGLQAALAQAPDPLTVALEALLAAEDAAAFNAVLVQHRAALMEHAADQALAQIADQAREIDPALARRAADQRATLGRFRATLQSRRAGMTSLLSELGALTAAEQAVLPALETMVHAVDPQAVYRQRIALDQAQQAQLDRLIERLLELAETARRSDLTTFLLTLQDLPNQ